MAKLSASLLTAVVWFLFVSGSKYVCLLPSGLNTQLLTVYYSRITQTSIVLRIIALLNNTCLMFWCAGCLGKWTQCVLDVPFPCAGGQDTCRVVCETNVGADMLIAYQCGKKELPRTSYSYCHCIYACQHKGLDQNNATSPDS